MASTATKSNLFAPIQVGNMMLKHPVVLAPMSRLRTTSSSAPLKVVREYYSQCASTPGTLLITEGTIVGPIGAGLKGSPGIWSGADRFVERQSNEVLYDIWSPQPLIVADGFTREKAFKAVELRDGVLVAFGRQFISNPDLPLRLKNNLPLSAYDRATFYGGDESGKGYTDYAFALQPSRSDFYLHFVLLFLAV